VTQRGLSELSTKSGVKYPAAASGPEGLWPGGKREAGRDF